MDSQRFKGLIIISIAILAISGITFFISVQFYKPELEKKLDEELRNKQQMVKVVVASKDILMGSVITLDALKTAEIPMINVLDKGRVPDGIGNVVGKIANTNIYENEQIVTDKLGFNVPVNEEDIKNLGKVEAQKIEQSDRYITVDIPNYNFVNGRVDTGSLVDILVDRGGGRYEVVLPKVIIYDKKEIGSKKDDSKPNSKNENIQPKKPSLKPVEQQSAGVPSGGEASSPLQDKNNPAFIDTDDYRVTLMVSENEHKRIFEAMTFGKLMTRLYVLPNQAPSLKTFNSNQETEYVRIEKEHNDYIKRLNEKAKADAEAKAKAQNNQLSVPGTISNLP